MRLQDPRSLVEFAISKSVIALLSKHRQWGFWSRERGGLLFAREIGTNAIEVCSASSPHRDDRATYASLILDPKRCADEICNANEAGLWFVGYWHTHPEKAPQLSNDDIRAFEQNLRSPAIGLSAMLAIVVGSSGHPSDFAYCLVSQGRAATLAVLTDK